MITEDKPQPNVLIVDDDPEFGLVVLNLVELEGYAASLATNVVTALALCQQKNIDVVLLDLKLGSESGLDVLREIRQNWPTIPVIVVTAHGSLETAAAAVREKAFDYIGKPFPVADLITVLRRALEWRATNARPVLKTPKITTQPTAIVGKSPAMVGV